MSRGSPNFPGGAFLEPGTEKKINAEASSLKTTVRSNWSVSVWRLFTAQQREEEQQRCLLASINITRMKSGPVEVDLLSNRLRGTFCV